MHAYIGLDIGGTKCAATLGTFDSEKPTILDKKYFLTEKRLPSEVLGIFSEFIEEKLKDYEIKGIGISCGGPLSSAKGVIMKPPSLPLWDNIEIVKYFKDKFSIDTYLQNDANACGVAEWKFGAGKGYDNVVFLTFGTGFGAGLILNGKLYSGANDNAGEIGHIRLTDDGPIGYYKAGSCEGYCSGSGIARLATIISKQKRYGKSYKEFEDIVGKDNVSAKTIAEYARKGNLFCRRVFNVSGKMLGKALSIVIDLLNPQVIILGGIFMRANDLLYPTMQKELEKECLPFSLKVVQILPAGLSENIGDYAALSIAKGDF